MAVMRNSIIFGGVDSADYGIYIGGEGTFNAPKRDVEMISIPGRNGAFALDKGRFENIEVTYSAFNYETDLATFAQNLSDFRNAICSQKGYQRLTDSFHPDEYRMATYNSGLEVKPIKYNTAAEFDIVFDCKPQRYLTSGEDPITIGEWNDTETASGTIASFEAKEGDGVKSLVVDIEPYQSGSGTPSPDNVRPISGYGSVVASVTGFNMLDAETGVASGTATYAGGVITNTVADTATSFNPTIQFLKDNTPVYRPDYIVNTTIGSRRVLTFPSGDYDADCLRLKHNGTSRDIPLVFAYNVLKNVIYCISYEQLSGQPNVAGGIRLKDICLSFNGSRNGAYEPYQGNTYTTNLNGTRYGGTLDVVSGMLTVTHGYVDLGTLTWNYDAGSTRLYSNVLTGVKIPAGDKTPDALSDRYVVTKAYGQSGGANGTISVGGTGALWVYDTSAGTSGSAFKTAVTGSTFVYELATPTTVQLTAQEVELLVGLNQIWANSGDVTVEYGTAPNVVYNPTLFEARPMLEVEGYGNININDDTITIADVTYGNIVVRAAKQYSGIIRTANASFTATHKFTVTKLNEGDTINVGQISCEATLKKLDGYNIQPMSVGAKSNATGGSNYLGTIRQIKTTDIQFSYETSDSITSYVTFVEKIKDSGGVTQWENASMQLVTSYDGAQTITAVLTVVSHTSMGYSTSKDVTVTFKDITADSTKSAIEGVAYIDLDIGEAWSESNGEAASLNNVVSIPAILPVLKPGANEITYDNTVTDLKLLPRWWKV